MTRQPKKAILLGVAQTQKHSVFQLEKKKDALNAIRALLNDLGFASWDYNRVLSPIDGADTGKPRYKFKATLYDDKYFTMSKGQYTIDIFFGKKKVVIGIYTVDDVRAELLASMMKYCERKEEK